MKRLFLLLTVLLLISCSSKVPERGVDIDFKKGFTDITTHLEWVAKDKVALHEIQKEKLQKLYDALSELDDVQEIYTNAA